MLLSGDRRHLRIHGHAIAITRFACRENLTVVRSCDEFPFASTHQGASLAGTNYSARAILATDNSTSGSWLGWWFERNRILEKQKFTVQISDSQQPGINGYYPPPPGTDTLADEQIVPDPEAP